MYMEAQKVGLDIGDLEEYGFDYDNLNFKEDLSYQDFEDKIKKLYTNVIDIMSGKISSDWQQAQCNPAVRKHVTPRVEFIWYLAPLDLILGGVGHILTIISCPIWICIMPLWICIIPWNMCFYALAIPLAILFFATLPCVACWACVLQVIQG